MAGNEETVLEVPQEKETVPVEESNDRLIQLPIARIKHLIKTDPDVSLTSQEAVVTIAKATELFIQLMARDAVRSTMQSKRKTLQRKDLDHVLDVKDCYAFLDGALDS